MFNRFDQAELPVTDEFGMPFSSLRKRQVEESMPEVPLRPNDPAILAANQISEWGMPIQQPEPRRPFVPEPQQQPPNPVGDLMPLQGMGRGGATTRQQIPEDDGQDGQNSQSINPLSSIALSKLQDFEAQGVPQQNPKLWQKLLALAAGAGSVVAAMNAERVRPDTQALAGMTNSILYPNEERNRARWMDQRALLRDAVRSEQTGNENVLKQMDLQRKSAVDAATIQKLGAQAGMYSSREETNKANTELAKWKQNIENIAPKTPEELKTRQLWQASKSEDPKVRAAADAELTKIYEAKIAKPKRTSVMDAEVAALTDEITRAAAINGVQIDPTEAREQALVKWGEQSAARKSAQAAATLEGTQKRTQLTEKNIKKPVSTGGRGRELTPLQQQNSAINGIIAHYLNATKNPDTTLNHEAAIKGIEADATLDQAKKDAAVLAIQKLRRSKGSGGNDMAGILSRIDALKSGNKTTEAQTPKTPQTPTVSGKPPADTVKTIKKFDPKTGALRDTYIDKNGKEITTF